MVAVELDVTDPASINAVAARLVADHPALNVLINNAGIMLADRVGGRVNDYSLSGKLRSLREDGSTAVNLDVTKTTPLSGADRGA
jgi:NAD(P)-dependent dehydrogenase (short-subunit alcohol dehydrogenase family)